MEKKLLIPEDSNNQWQTKIVNIGESMAYLYNNDLMSDLSLIVQDSKIPVHKFILASRSPVFYSMFYGQLAETKSEIKLLEPCSTDSFFDFLKYIYRDEIDLTWDNVLELLSLSKYYIIPNLSRRCVEFLEASVSEDTVLNTLQQCLRYDEKLIVELCLELIGREASDILKKESFLELDLETLTEVLKLDQLAVEEMELFFAVEKWCESKLRKEGRDISPESKREVLGDARTYIRYPRMSLEDFSKSCVLSGLVTNEEIRDLVHTLSVASEDQDKEVSARISFPREARIPEDRHITIDRISSGSISNRRWEYYRKEPDFLVFEVSKKAKLAGVSVFGDPTSNEITSVTLETSEGLADTSCFIGAQNSSTIDGSFRIDFNPPVEILANTQNVLGVAITGESTYRGDYKRTCFDKNGFQCTFSSASSYGNGTNSTTGQFPELFFFR